MNPEPRSGPPRSVLVVRLGAMGDVIHTLAAVAALRNSVPDMQIGWAVEGRWAELLVAKDAPLFGPKDSSRPLVDFVHVFNTKVWRKSLLASETRTEIAAAFKEVRAQKYEMATDFQGAVKSALVARFAGAQEVAGMARPREAPARLLYGRRMNTTGRHVVEQYNSLAEAIAGKPLSFTALDFPHDSRAESAIDAKLGARANIVILNPGAGWAAKQWPAENYGELAKLLAADGMAPVINFGPGEEKLAYAAESSSAGTATAVSCSISELIALTRRARLFIGGDTGPLHLAAALQIPVVAIFGPTDPARNGPYGTRSVVLRNAASQNSLSHTATPDPGLLQITTGEVASAARQLLKEANA